MKVIVGITGASGSIIGYRILQALKQQKDVETHLIISDSAQRTIEDEMQCGCKDFCALTDHVHDSHDMEAVVCSGSYKTDGMIVAPCSMKTLSAIANGYDENLIVRAADVCLKENRRVVLVPREMPLSKAYLRNLSACADGGCSIIPPMMTFYNNPKTIDDMINHVVGKVLLQFGIEFSDFKPWRGKS